MKNKIKRGFLKVIEWSLGAHGVLHFFEFGTAIYEEAYITASFAAFGGITMILGAIFLGHTHHHHHHHHIKNKED
mgnify:FL=1|tara:strand:- start:2698 stop:2922 length:225 start_codon:yes stop_codon:yes gene_type:complete